MNIFKRDLMDTHCNHTVGIEPVKEDQTRHLEAQSARVEHVKLRSGGRQKSRSGAGESRLQ